VTYKVYSGTYTFYAGADLLELDEWADVDAAVSAHRKTVVAMRTKHWDTWENKPADMREVSRQWIVDQEYVVAVRETSSPDQTEVSAQTEVPAKSGQTGEPADLPADSATAPVQLPAANATNSTATQQSAITPSADIPADDAPQADSAAEEGHETSPADAPAQGNATTI
jgi:hypothetical protein